MPGAIFNHEVLPTIEEFYLMRVLEEDIAPMWVGEFGAPGRPNKGDAHYWKNLLRYLKSIDADFGYWASNPRRPRTGNLLAGQGRLAVAAV